MTVWTFPSNWRFAAFLAALAAFFAPMGPALAADLLDVRLGVRSPTETRIVLDLTGPADYQISGDDAGSGRVIIELKDAKAAPSMAAIGAGRGLIARYEARQSGSTLRVTLDLAAWARLKTHDVLKGTGSGVNSRIYLDLAAAPKNQFLASLPSRRFEDLDEVIRAVTAEVSQAPAPVVATPALEPEPATQAERRKVIVIDPGHGGRDPGAVGPAGTNEKAVTLAAALELARILRARERYEVVLTRDDDERIGVEDRSKKARDAGADLFISLHADAHRDPQLRGSSVYTLSEKGSKRSAREAENAGDYHVFRENGVNMKDHPNIGGILFDLAQRETKNASARFADMLIEDLARVTPLVNNTHRTGDLFVLLAPDVPAVLLELAFISNAEDEKNLNSATWRAKTMTGVANAIDRYFQASVETRHAGRAAKGGR